MKNMKFLTAALFVSSLFIGCSKDDAPAPVNEEEVITTLTVTLVPNDGIFLSKLLVSRFTIAKVGIITGVRGKHKIPWLKRF